MLTASSLLLLAHLVGLALGVGAATVKLTLLFRCRTDVAFVPVYLGVAKPVTRQIIIGQVLLTLSGIGWLLSGYGITPLMGVKLGLVAAIWVLGPYIDNAVEPRFRKLAPVAGASASPEFIRIQKRHLALEVVATGVFYAIILLWLFK